MQVRIQIGQIAECLYGYRRGRCYVFPSHGCLENISYRLPAAAGEFGKKPAVPEEMKPYPLGDGKHYLPVRDGSEDLGCQDWFCAWQALNSRLSGILTKHVCSGAIRT